MRVFCIIFSFYLLLLSWQPCQDLAIKGDSRPSADSAQRYFQDSQSPEEIDDCSPFCICSCCQISTIETRFAFSVTGDFEIFSEKSDKISYQSNYFRQYSNSIWQPPKFNFTA